MPLVSPQHLIKLQETPEAVRNICILAHVDHGKTSLTDSLLATNGIISPRMAGKIRYLDSRPDEQVRGITMESSAISLLFTLMRKSPSPDAPPTSRDHLINLIDSPGHVDFSSEVSTASRLCDGALVLVDAVEGVCSQTIAVLRQGWVERLKPILVVNKMDRLVTELKMSPAEAYSHLSKLIEQVNAIVGSFFQGERMEDDLRWRERLEAKVQAKAQNKPDADASSASEQDSISEQDIESAANLNWEEKGDEDIYFEPDKGNVIFSSAIDGWAFTIKQFAGFYERKLGIKRTVLEKVLWGDYYLDPKTKRVLGHKHLKGRSLKPMFVQLVLENIWAVYEAVTGGDKGKGNPEMTEKITKSLSISLPSHVVRSRDPRAILLALWAAWIPLSTAVLVSVIEHLPSPSLAQGNRMPAILDASPGADSISSAVREAMTGLQSARSSPLVAFVSKMVSVPAQVLPENKTKSGTTLTAEEARELGRKKRAEIARAQAAVNGDDPDVAELRESLNRSAIGETNGSSEEPSEKEEPAKEHLVGFARLFSGTLEVGDELYVLPPKFTPSNPNATPKPQKVTITALYLLMGRELESLTKVPPGVVFGIGGLEGHVMKSATLSNQVEGAVNLAGVSMGGQPIVRVALEPENPADLDKMVRGMKLLEQSDPCARYEMLESGEHVMLTAGELHLERCLKDLRERFAGCEIQVGAPIVPYREGIVSATEMNPPHQKDLPRGTVVTSFSAVSKRLRLRVRPLPNAAFEYLQSQSSSARQLLERQREFQGQLDESENVDIKEDDGNDTSNDSPQTDHAEVNGKSNSLAQLRAGLAEALASNRADREVWKTVAENTIAFGPRNMGPNILVDSTKGRVFHESTLGSLSKEDATANKDASQTQAPKDEHNDLANRISYAFQLATAQGPLCAEPMQGVAVMIEEFVSSSSSSSSTDAEPETTQETSARFVGEVIKTTRESIRQGFLDWSPRLFLAMYSCEIQASAEVLGRVYGVVTRRRGRILSESMNEGTPFFTITASIPVAESFGFSEEIRKRTSGAASPQLIFSGFEMLDEDPFWVPFTEEQLEDLGETADRDNLAKKYMDGVRRRKGMFVQGSKIVESAEKQKTLKR